MPNPAEPPKALSEKEIEDVLGRVENSPWWWAFTPRERRYLATIDSLRARAERAEEIAKDQAFIAAAAIHRADLADAPHRLLIRLDQAESNNAALRSRIERLEGLAQKVVDSESVGQPSVDVRAMRELRAALTEKEQP